MWFLEDFSTGLMRELVVKDIKELHLHDNPMEESASSTKLQEQPNRSTKSLLAANLSRCQGLKVVHHPSTNKMVSPKSQAPTGMGIYIIYSNYVTYVEHLPCI